MRRVKMRSANANGEEGGLGYLGGVAWVLVSTGKYPGSHYPAARGKGAELAIMTQRPAMHPRTSTETCFSSISLPSSSQKHSRSFNLEVYWEAQLASNYMIS